MVSERRRFTRVPFQMATEIEVEGTSYACGEITNLSVGGCLLPVDKTFAVGAPCRVRIDLGGPASHLTVEAQGEIVRNDPGAVAVRFTAIEPDSLFHLGNIIRYNASDADAVEQEINHHRDIE